LGRTGSAQDIANIIKRIRLNDYNRDKRDYLKRKNREYEKMRSQMNLSGKIEEELKEETAPTKKKSSGTRNSKKGSGTKKGASKTLKGLSTTKKNAGKYEVRIQNVESSNEDEEDPKKQKKEGSSEEDEEAAEERKKRKNLKEIAKYDIKS